MKNILLVLFFSLILFNSSLADDTYSGTSYNWNTGEFNSVDVTFDNTYGTSEIEVYNYSSGEYEYHDIETSSQTGFGTELETYNYSTGEYNSIEID